MHANCLWMWPRSLRANTRRSARPRPPRLGTALYLRWESYSPASLLKMRRSILRFSMVILVRLRYYLLLGPEMLPGFQVCSARRIAQHEAQRAGVRDELPHCNTTGEHRMLTGAGWSYRSNERGWIIYRDPQTRRGIRSVRC
jgi:hypothetical protein